ncbi:MAG: hypothetical protein WAX14_21970 [Rhodococcus sp. (in: high G+C Gram-positive bacteria)]|uniref:hypothetical protein n=1 Tax=Rhodococcus sp. TaxID=1831 RepID=UPI003BB7E132
MRNGHYESFYQRANHPTKPLAFWIRYTAFVPAGRPEASIGELWFILFDGDTGDHTVMKEEVPISECSFSADTFDVRIGDALLTPRSLTGDGRSAGRECGWDLTYSSDHKPVLLQPYRAYSAIFPKAKSLVPNPLAVYDGALTVGGREIVVDGWIGSQNHNWGSAHTDRYAFAQVAGFDGEPDAFLELATAQVKIGPLRTPSATMLVLRAHGREYNMTSLFRAVRNRGKYTPSEWRFDAGNDRARIYGCVSAPDTAFVDLEYCNPAGGTKYCRNTKIGRCTLEVHDKTDGSRFRLTTETRALFEILT